MHEVIVRIRISVIKQHIQCVIPHVGSGKGRVYTNLTLAMQVNWLQQSISLFIMLPYWSAKKSCVLQYVKLIWGCKRFLNVPNLNSLSAWFKWIVILQIWLYFCLIFRYLDNQVYCFQFTEEFLLLL